LAAEEKTKGDENEMEIMSEDIHLKPKRKLLNVWLNGKLATYRKLLMLLRVQYVNLT